MDFSSLLPKRSSFFCLDLDGNQELLKIRSTYVYQGKIGLIILVSLSPCFRGDAPKSCHCVHAFFWVVLGLLRGV